MATTIQTQVAMYTVGLFGAAPGGYMNGLAAHFMANGTEASFVNTLVNSVEYRTYVANWPAMSAADQAAKIVSTLLGETSGSAYDAGVQAVQGLLSGGASYASAAYSAASFLAGATADATYGAYAADFNARIANAIEYSISEAGSQQFALAELQAQASTEVNLTNGTDVRTANQFNAGLVYVPGGNDRINSLQDEDTLTGSGTNPTLDATMGNANDNGGIIITPTLTGIEVLNLEFTGTVNQLDLQDASGISDAININRISDNAANTTTIDNITSIPVDLSLSNSGQEQQTVTFGFTNTAAKGTADSVNLKISNVNVAALTVQEAGPTAATAHDTALDQGVETINMSSVGSSNTITLMNAEDLKTWNISGDQALTIGGEGNMAGSLSTVDASTLTGNLTFTLTPGIMTTTPDGMTTGNVALTFKSGTGTDSVRVSEQIGTNDTFDLGAGTDTLRFQSASAATVDFVALNTAANNVSNVENVQLWKTGTQTAAVLSLRADEMTGDQAIELRDHITGVTGAALTTQYNVVNLSAAEATTISIAHSGNTTNVGNPGASWNGLANNLVELDVDTGVTAVNFTIKDGVNSEGRFNFQLYTDSDRTLGTTAATATAYSTAQDAGTTNAVTDLTITDSDGESNTVDLQADGYLSNVAQGDGTAYTKVTLKGGTAGQFLNLDTSTATGGMYGYVTTGASTGDLTGVTNVAGAATRLSAATIDASTFVGDAIVRVGNNFNDTNGAQAISMGTGNDTVIFDNQASGNSGLSIADTVKGGTGTDTLAFEGSVAVTLGASEWTNVSGFETIRLLGNGVAENNAANAVNSYNLTLTDALVDNNASDGARINIVNDSDSANDTNNTADTAGTGVERGVTINAVALSASNSFSYNGEEGATRTADRFIFADAGINGSVVIDGGAVDNTTTNHVSGAGGNADVIEMRNATQADLGDLVGIKNVATLSFTSVGATTTQVSRLQLNDTIVDALVDSYQSSVSRAATAPLVPNVETLTVNAVDNMSDATYTVGLTIEAGTLTDKSDLAVTLGRGANNVATGGGQDRVVLLGNYVAGTYAAVTENGVALNGQSTAGAVARVVSDTINLGTGTDTLVTYGAINLAGTLTQAPATLAGIETLTANSALVLTATQYNALTSLRFEGNTPHQLTIVDDIAGANAISLDKIVLAAGTLVYDATSSSNTTGGSVNNMTVTAGTSVRDTAGVASASASAGTVGTAPTNGGGVSTTAVTVTAGGSFTGTAGVNDNFSAAAYANLNGTTITGTDADTETLTMGAAVAAAIGGGGAAGTITNIDTLVLANVVNAVTFGASTGIKNVTGGTAADTITTANMTAGGLIDSGADADILTLSANLNSTTINLGAGADSITSAVGAAITTTMVGGADTDTLVLITADDLTNASVSGFETLTVTAGATITVGANSLLTQFTTIAPSGAGAETINIVAGAHNVSAAAYTIDSAAGDTVTISSGASLTMAGDAQITAANTVFTGAGTLITTAALTLAAADTITNVTFGGTGLTITDVANVSTRTVTGSTGNDTYVSTLVQTGATTVAIASGGSDTISLDSAGTATGTTTVTGFTVGATASGGDVINLSTAGLTAETYGIVTGGATITTTAPVVDATQLQVLSSASYQVAAGQLTATGDGGYVEAAIIAAAMVTDDLASFNYVVLDDGISTGVYRVAFDGSAGTALVIDNAADIVSVQLVAVLSGITDAGTLTSANFV